MLYIIRVLIPLNSGLVFTADCAIVICDREGLNPFEFRAGIYCETPAVDNFSVKS